MSCFLSHMCIILLDIECMVVIIKLKLPDLVRPLATIQPFIYPLKFNFPWSLGYIRKLAFRSPWGNYFGAMEYLAQVSEIHFLCPEKFALGQCRIRTTDISICSRTRFHWTNATPIIFNSEDILQRKVSRKQVQK